MRLYIIGILAIMATVSAMACADKCCQPQYINNTIVQSHGGGMGFSEFIDRLGRDSSVAFWQLLDKVFVNHTEYEARISELESRVLNLEAELSKHEFDHWQAD